MSGTQPLLLAGIMGVVTGFITIHSPLAASWLSIFLWITVGLAVVFFLSNNRKSAGYIGATFGFFNIASWLLSGFQGASDKLGGFLLLTLVISILGAGCGLAGAYLFSKLFRIY